MKKCSYSIDFVLTQHWLHPCFSPFVQTKTTKIYKYFGG
jgi:hypothetical protein